VGRPAARIQDVIQPAKRLARILVPLTTRAEHFSKTPGDAPAMLAVMSGMAP
jgi:hypothetical protein